MAQNTSQHPSAARPSTRQRDAVTMIQTTEVTPGRPAMRRSRLLATLRRRQRHLSDRVHAAGDALAAGHGWTITQTTGTFGFGARTYRDPRFDRRH